LTDRIQQAKPLSYYRHDFSAMGSPCELQLYAENKDQAQVAFQAVVADIERLEKRYSRYRPDSFLSEINQAAARQGLIEVDAETASLLDYAATCYQESNGLFDISSGLLRQAWNFKSPQLPETDQLQQLLERIGWQKLQWQSPYLKFPDLGMELDFGGIVKEYAADRADSLCRVVGISHGAINLGGDIKIIGPHPDGKPWRIGIRHPRQKDGLLSTVLLYRGAMASSGDYERSFELAGHRYGHILNPKTGWPVSYLTSVSVVADFCVIAGSASTIAMLKEHEGPGWLQNLGLEHLWVDVSGQRGGSLNR
jgi:thiamine biosynthesis lipoprotein